MRFTLRYLQNVLFTRAFFAFTALALSPQALAQDTFEERIPPSILRDKPSFFTLTAENDLFGGGTDRNYTNGVRLSWLDVGAKVPNFIEEIGQAIPTFDVNETTSISYSLGQNLYTPENIKTATPDPQDRPYAAFLYGSAGMTTVTDNHIDDLEVTLGVVGPAALGEFAQSEVHHLVNSPDPKGWDHQLKNEPGLMLSWQRMWPEAFATDVSFMHLRIAPHAGITAGNIYTYAAGGLTAQLTPKQYQWQSQPLRVRPAIPGNGFFAVPEDRFAWSLFAGVEERAVARNIFLDGNSFTDSPSVDKKYFVTDANGGVALTYGRTQLSYTLNWRSEEFHGQGDASVFGAISLGYRF